MIRDAENIFSTSQALTATAASTDVIDLGANGDLGRASMRFRASVATAFSGGTSVQFVLQTDDNSGFSSATALFTSAAIAVASLTAGAVVVDIPVPSTTERYLRVNYVVVGTPTAGAVDAFLVLDTPNQVTYPDAVTVY
jgi:hypothetical protein